MIPFKTTKVKLYRVNDETLISELVFENKDVDIQPMDKNSLSNLRETKGYLCFLATKDRLLVRTGDLLVDQTTQVKYQVNNVDYFSTPFLSNLQIEMTDNTKIN